MEFLGVMIGNGHGMLWLSILILGLGPLLYKLSDRSEWMLSVIEGFVLISVSGIVLFHVLPHAMERLGGWAFLGAAVGFVGPLILGSIRRFTKERAENIALFVALVGLVIHGSMDGMALLMPSSGSEGGGSLALAVILHRLPMGLAIWWLIRPAFGVWKAVTVLLLMAASTVMGYSLGGYYGALLHGTASSVFQAVVAGSLFHVILHRPNGGSEVSKCASCAMEPPSWKVAEFMGALLGFFVVVFLSIPSLHSVISVESVSVHLGEGAFLGHFVERFFDLALVSAPALFLGYLLAGLMTEFFPQSSLRWLKRGRSFEQTAKGMVFGIPLPICSCGIVPIYRGLIKKGVPTTAAMSFLIATPELGVESLLLTIPLLGFSFAGLRLLSAASVALLVGWFVGRLALERAQDLEEVPVEESKRLSLWERLKRVVAVGFGDVVEDTAAWILLGLLIASLIQPMMLAPLVSWLPFGADIFLFAMLGIPVYVCASGATPLAAALIYSGVSPGAALAFLLSGPATNVTTFGVLSKLHGKKIAALFGLGVMLSSVFFGFLVNIFLGSSFHAAPPKVGAHGVSWLSLGTLILLGIAFLVVILKQGPRNFILSIFSMDSDDDGHSHGVKGLEEEHHHGDGHEEEHSCGCGSACIPELAISSTLPEE